MRDMVENIIEQRALVEKICELQRKLDMTERAIDDCIIILCDRNVKHRTVEYDENDIGIAKALFDICYDVAEKLKKAK